MKNSILTIMAVAALASCKKNETTVVDSSTDSMNMAMPADSGMMPMDSATVVGGENVTTMSDQDKMFADDAAKGGMMEVMAGEYAEKNGMNEKVKALGKMIKDDHMKANDELKSWATTVNYMLPTKMDADQQKMVDDLKMKKGADFDKAYTDMMVNDHKKDIAAFKKQATEGSASALKSFASKTVPTLEGHLAASEAAMNAVK